MRVLHDDHEAKDEDRTQRSLNGSDLSSASGHVLKVAAPGMVLSFPFPGPRTKGPIVIGRGLDADIRVPMPDMSRKHLSMRWDDDGVLQVADVGSSNGTTLRGEKLVVDEWKMLTTRELVLVSDGAVVVQEGNATDAPSRLVGYEAFEATLQAQVKNFAKKKEMFGVVAIELDSEGAWTDFVGGVLARTDSIGYLSERSVRVLLVNRSVAEIETIVAFLTRGLTTFSSNRNVTVKICPRDGDNLTALYSGARERRDTYHRETRRPSAPIVQSHAMAKVYELVGEVANTPTSILILGETGVGKDVLARAIHQKSNRANAPLVGLNCAALPESLLESELFGYERGAFTGAVAAKQGLLESAEGGTVFLDEVGEMPLSTQAKLLRVLEERKVMRLGGLRPKAVDFRLVAATNRNLQAEIAAGRFRADVFYRINGLAISIPPLRERRDEIVTLTHHFADKAAATLGKNVPLFSAEALQCFERYTWPGNIRELKSVVERAVLLARAGVVLLEHLPDEVISKAVSRPPPPGPDERPTEARLPILSEPDEGSGPRSTRSRGHYTPAGPPSSRMAIQPPGSQPPASMTSLKNELERIEYDRITAALAEAGGNQTRAAASLGMTRRALIIRLERYGITRPRKKGD